MKRDAFTLWNKGVELVQPPPTVRVAACVSGVMLRSVVGEALRAASTKDSGVEVALVRSSLGSNKPDSSVPNMPARLGSWSGGYGR